MIFWRKQLRRLLVELCVLIVFTYLQVSDFYHDSSSGHLMNVVVVRVMFLEKEEEEIDLTISANADETLASFCKWQQTVNPKDITHPNHHDIAVLLTRSCCLSFIHYCILFRTNCGLSSLTQTSIEKT